MDLQFAVTVDIDHVRVQPLRAARIFETLRTVGKRALGFRLAHLIADLRLGGDARRHILEQQRVRLDGVEEFLEFLHGAIALLVVATGQCNRCAEHGRSQQGIAEGHLVRVKDIIHPESAT